MAAAEHFAHAGLWLGVLGLEAIAQKTSGVELEEKLTVVTSERAQTQVQLQEAGLRLQAAREREETTARSYRALAERTRQQLWPPGKVAPVQSPG